MAFVSELVARALDHEPDSYESFSRWTMRYCREKMWLLSALAYPIVVRENRDKERERREEKSFPDIDFMSAKWPSTRSRGTRTRSTRHFAGAGRWAFARTVMKRKHHCQQTLNLNPQLILVCRTTSRQAESESPSRPRGTVKQTGVAASMA